MMMSSSVTMELPCRTYGDDQAQYTRWFKRDHETASWVVAESVVDHKSAYLRNLTRFRHPEFGLVGADHARMIPRVSVDAHRNRKISAQVEALIRDMDQAVKEAQHEDGVVVSRASIESAHTIVTRLAGHAYGVPAIHATDDGGLAFDFRKSGSTSGVLLICEPDGAGVCIYDLDGRRGRQRSDSIDGLWELGAKETLKRLVER